MKIRAEEHEELVNKKLRFDLFLSQLSEFDGISRSVIKQIIESNKVYVNGEVCFRANYKVRAEDIIELEDNLLDEFVIDPEGAPQPENIPLEIVYEDDDLVAVNKPEGMVVHPATGNWSGTLVNALLGKYKSMESVGQTIRAGLVHRLDKDTSGLILVGKTNKGLWHYSKQFATRKVKKEYLLLCKSNDQMQPERVVQTYIARNDKNRKKMQAYELNDSELPNSARISETKFFLKEQNSNLYLFSAFPKTGRTHQIRVHSNYLNAPIVGDIIYGGEKSSRLMLHAYELEITHLSGKKIIIKAPVPETFNKVLESYEIKKIQN